jgi:hypothetical protein
MVALLCEDIMLITAPKLGKQPHVTDKVQCMADQ